MKSSHNKPNAVPARTSTPPGKGEIRGNDVEAMESGSGLRPIALALLTLALIVLCLMLAYPLLPAITWGLALAILAIPMHRLVVRIVPWPGLAAGLSTAVVVFTILGTLFFVTYQITQEARSAAERARSSPAQGGLLDRVKGVKVIGPAAKWLESKGMDLENQALTRIQEAAGNIQSLAQGSVAAAVQFLIAVFILYYLLKEPETFLNGMRELLPLSRSESDQLFSRAADAIHANLHATLVTSIIDTIGFGILFWWAAIPGWILWTVIMFVLSLLPILGAGVVWLPAIGYEAMNGRWLQAGVLLAWGVFTFTLVDNALYACMAGGRMKTHEVPALISFMGGLVLFGMSGIILGPVVLTLTLGLIEIWKARMARVA